MWGQGQLKVQDINLRDPGEKKLKISKLLFLPQTALFSMQNFTGSSIVLFSSFCVTYFCQKMNLKIWHMDIFEAFARYESHFQTDWREFWLIYIPYIHDTHIVRFFLKILIWEIL